MEAVSFDDRTADCYEKLIFRPTIGKHRHARVIVRDRFDIDHLGRDSQSRAQHVYLR